MLYTIMVTEKQIRSQFYKVHADSTDEAIARVKNPAILAESEYTSIRSKRAEVVNVEEKES